MNVIVDTSVWSLALRRAQPRPSRVTDELAALVRERRVILLGPVRQEVLSGVKEPKQFETLRRHLRAFPDLDLDSVDFEEAASCYNRCRAKGVQGANTDFLLCATAVRRKAAVFTTDGDFHAFAKILPVSLHEPR